MTVKVFHDRSPQKNVDLPQPPGLQSDSASNLATEAGLMYMYSTAQVKEPIFFFISRTNFTIRDFPPSGLE